MIKVGIVVSTVDSQSAGIITIEPIGENVMAGTKIQALPCSPNLGGGAGFLSVPGPGNTVLYVDMPPAEIPGRDSPVRHAWLGCIPTIMPEEKGRSPVTSDRHDADEGNTSQLDPTPRPDRTQRVVGLAVPEAENIYADNQIPQQDIWKQKNGHKIVMSHKITKDGTHNNSVLVQAASGKRLILDDGSPALAMDRISLQDEKLSNEQGPNRVRIITGSKTAGETESVEIISERDQRFFSTKGNQYQLIHKGKGTQYRENKGEGDIVDFSYKGNHKTVAEKNIVRIAGKGDIIESASQGDIKYQSKKGLIDIEAAESITLTVGATSVVITEAGVTITGPGGVINTGGTLTTNGIVLDTHTHGGVESGSSNTDIPQ